MASIQQVKDYCKMCGLFVGERPELDALDGPEEWEGVQLAGFSERVGSLSAPPPMIVLEDDGTVKVFIAHADGRQFMEDKYVTILDTELVNAINTHVRLHPRQ